MSVQSRRSAPPIGATVALDAAVGRKSLTLLSRFAGGIRTSVSRSVLFSTFSFRRRAFRIVSAASEAKEDIAK